MNLYIKVEEVIKNWIEYFMESIVDEPCLAFNYAQAGQENSFTWAGMGKGLELQFPILWIWQAEQKECFTVVSKQRGSNVRIRQSNVFRGQPI